MIVLRFPFKWVKSLPIVFWIVAELYNCWRIVERCRLAQFICSRILCAFWNLLLIVITVLLCVWCVGCWLCCIFTCLEIDILYTLANFPRSWSFYTCEHIGAGDGSGSSKCLAQGVWRIYSLDRRMKQTCFEKVEQHEDTKSLQSNIVKFQLS